MKIHRAAAIILVALCQGCRPAETIDLNPRDVSLEGNRNVTVSLNGRPAEVVGVDWTYGEMKVVEELHTIHVKFPGGNVFRSYSKMTILDQKDGRVTGIKVLPMKDIDSFGNAVSMVKQIVEEFGVADQARVRGQLEKWEDSVPVFSDSMGAILEHRVYLFVRLEQHRQCGGWFVGVDLNYLGEDSWNALKDER
jgi:hypothetical protein